MTDYVEFECLGRIHRIPNAWELLEPLQFAKLCSYIDLFAAGKMTAGMVKAMYVCDLMGWNIKKITDESAMCNLIVLAENVTFIFNIEYPDEVSSSLTDAEKERYSKISPEHSSEAIARYLAGSEYRFVLDSVFCAQLIPSLQVGKIKRESYKISTKFGALTCSLTALQYLEAKEVASGRKDQLPLLASILYQTGIYQSEKAQSEATLFAKLPEKVLQAVAFNFISFNNYLFQKTPFSLLTAGKAQNNSSISVGALESLYNLSTDGYGDINTIEQMNLIQYLTINRKKIIESIRSMNDAKMKITEIASNTGLPIQTINEILK